MHGCDDIYYKYISTNKLILMDKTTAKLFWSGRSQAVRLPKEFRFAGDAVQIRRHGSAVILEPVADDWKWLDVIIGKLDQDFVEAATEQNQQQERPALDTLFR
jgi:antitoxin VapB